MRIALCIIATGRYDCFVGPLLDSAREFFLAGHERRFFVFSDRPMQEDDALWVPTPHRPWPGPTLYRYHTMLGAECFLRDHDYVFYCDADMRFVAHVGEEILPTRHPPPTTHHSPLTAVLHPGYCWRRPGNVPYERRPESRACVPPGGGARYYAGGFQGGESAAWLRVCRALAEAIDDDARRGITARWHDESHWNRLLADNRPEIVLPPGYCSHEDRPEPDRRILALNKNHAELRA